MPLTIGAAPHGNGTVYLANEMRDTAGWRFYWALKNIPGIRLCTTYEVPFATANGAVVTRETCREIGEDTTAVFKQFLTRPTAR
ncbi:MAG: hypothetical protein PHV28_10925 [Kiritimatiellae bacterium]|nr:hypothetical protein [Kiritimatiellia bacterium]